MSDVTPSFTGEVQFRRYSDTSTQGQQLVFAVHDREALAPFIGKEGKRYMAVFVEIGDDELPMPAVPPPKEREPLGDLCYRAVMLCQDQEFRRWLKDAGDFREELLVNDAADVIKGWCGIESRKELDTDKRAAEKFRKLVLGPWFKYRQARGTA